ncbi:phospholipid-transporting ATPase ID-like [Dendronephthya gigantea]|uniref:phospholipid-transporting ATPase ID-like n=1 Tax=Dendronephthya gigantea TaxID=151771 RepID=UPI00106C3FB4|nr:phospholipid-transporting ATPase ID-like [Dendronephthya gigantea]
MSTLACVPKFKTSTEDDHEETDRVIKCNDTNHTVEQGYVDNYICTSKYTLISFLPKNLFEQFHRLANIYFLCQIIIMSIPELTALKPESTAVPLFFVLLATAVKDGYDDIKRHMSDNEVNGRKTNVLREGQLREEQWLSVQVGQVLRLNNNDQVPADLLVLTTSEDSGLCYIETAELDGETNLKCRQPLVETAEMGDDQKELQEFNGEIICETPNNTLDKFRGTLYWEGEKYSLDNEKIILRGCVLRNTQWIYGVVIFAGADTKLMMNTGQARFKTTSLDRLLNKLVGGIAVLLATICVFCSIMSAFWESETGRNFQIYLKWESFYKDSPALIGVFHWPGYIMVLNTLIPISLYISVEIIRLGQSLFINWDSEMYYKPKSTPARARTTTLTEELGQIQYIFSDKTGTLTQNIMTFKQCSIAGTLYGNLKGPEVSLQSGASMRSRKSVDFSGNQLADDHFHFYDQTLVTDIQGNSKKTHDFFRLIALCHSVISEEVDGDLEYQAQSPDEAALVTAARNFGFVFLRRSPTTVTLECLGKEETWELLCILDFDNVRKRMSVIVRRDNEIKLYCKGADTIIFERLDPSCQELVETTTKHLNTFAKSGLRTLVLAEKDITEEYFKDWMGRYHEASTAADDRDEKINETYEEIETNMKLIGATAIEDKLQDGVPAAIANLAKADIKIWVLTGDKQETAINIGYSCQLLTDEMEDPFIVDGEDESSVRASIRDYMNKVRGSSKASSSMENSIANDDVSVGILPYANNDASLNSVLDNSTSKSASNSSEFALVIRGKSLVFALDPSFELEFLELATHCKAVICCRVTPLQKALVVELVKRNVKAVTLAIGDGANDVSMIKSAHIGVGISGQEGMQAVLASDYSFAQFRFLERLLLVHGRWSYMRMAKFLGYFFYKNFAFTLCQLWFAFFVGFSAQTLYDAWFISFYNVFFTSLPVVIMGIFDQDVSDKVSLKNPKLYVPGQQNILFNKKIFLLSLLRGAVVSLVLYFVPYGIFHDHVNNDGEVESGLQFFGTVVAATLVITMNLQVALDMQSWTVLNHISVWGSIIVYFLFYFVFYSAFVFGIAPQQSYYGVQYAVYSSGSFWLCVLLTPAIAILPVFAYRSLVLELKPTISDSVRRMWKTGKTVNNQVKFLGMTARSSGRSGSKRLGYAFAQEERLSTKINAGRQKRLKFKSKSKR